MQDHHAAAREAMVERQIKARGITGRAVLDAMRTVPRHLFVSSNQAARAYEDCPLPIGMSQTISQPYIVALMVEAAEIGGDSDVLEVGAGSGYAAAVVGRIARSMVAIERHETLAAEAAHRLASLGYRNVEIVVGDGMAGWPDKAPYDAILVSAAGASVPPALFAQLKTGGRLVIPVGSRLGGQALKLYRRIDDVRIETVDLGEVRFVPLVPGVCA